MAKNRIHFTVLILFSVVLFFSSCRTVRELPTVEAKPIPTGRLLKKVEQNAFDYDYLTIKRINCQFSDNDSKTNFKANLKAVKDQQILVSISKLNIPVGRVLLTPDSVKYVNYIERNYFIDDYSYLSKALNIDLDFTTIQSILSNNAFSYRSDKKDKDFRNFISYIDSGMYVIQSEKERKIEKIEEKGKAGKMDRMLKRFDQDALVLQKMYFNPANFALLKLTIDDKTNSRKMQMDFDDFTNVRNNDFPGSISMKFISPQGIVGMDIKMNGFSTEKIGSFNFKIPDKYDRIKINER